MCASTTSVEVTSARRIAAASSSADRWVSGTGVTLSQRTDLAPPVGPVRRASQRGPRHVGRPRAKRVFSGRSARYT